MAEIQTHRRRYLIALLLTCPLAAYLALPRPPDFSVEKRAKRLASASDWSPVQLAGNLPYRWVSDHEVVVHHDRAGIDVIDVDTGGRKPLPQLTAAYRARPDLKSFTPGLPDWDISPDGKWLLTYASAAGKVDWVLMAIDGSRIVKFHMAPTRYPMSVWDRDSLGFVQIYNPVGRLLARRYRYAPSEQSPPEGRVIDLGVVPGRFTASFIALGEPKPNHVLLANWFDVNSDKVAMRIYNVNASRLPRRDFEVHLPAGAGTVEAEMSPNGVRVAWDLSFYSGLSGGSPFLHRLPFMPLGPGHADREIWVSNIDGTDMHPVVTAGTQARANGPGYVRWTPDGSRVSFVYNDAFYAVAAR